MPALKFHLHKLGEARGVGKFALGKGVSEGNDIQMAR